VKQNISPVAAVVAVIGILIILAGVFFWQNRGSTEAAKETAQRGAERGQMMMNAQQGGMTNEEMMKRMKAPSR